MKKLSTWNKGVHYLYKGYTIYKDKERDSETKYSYAKDGKILGHARTLSLAKLWVNIDIDG